MPLTLLTAINKMDGRQYAVKKIPLDAHSAGGLPQNLPALALVGNSRALLGLRAACLSRCTSLRPSKDTFFDAPSSCRAFNSTCRPHSQPRRRNTALPPRRPAGAYARIMREVTTLSRLQHPNVVRYFQVSPLGGMHQFFW